MKVVKSENTEKKVEKDFQTKWKEHKEKYLKDHTVAEMVYENGSALALLFKEVQRLNTNLLTVINDIQNGKEDKDK